MHAVHHYAVREFSEGLAEFLEEARKLAQFAHPNIVRVTRYFEANATGYFVMDHESGGSLRDILDKAEALMSEDEIEAIIAPLCQGLTALHRSGLLHRDVKPDNFVVRPDGSPVLIDFGASVRFGESVKGPTVFIGTPAYAPAEQFDPDGNIGPWTDIYSMGAVMYEMVAGRRPTPAYERVRGAEMVPASTISPLETEQRCMSGRRRSARRVSSVRFCLTNPQPQKPAERSLFPTKHATKRSCLRESI